MVSRNFILATAGHVDHGKSALVKALTGIDPDRLPEEKARGITIDLGFAHLELHSTLNNQPATLRLGIVDVPGHEDFVKNMVAGVGSIDLALFVVAADDGWMPQTEEHLQILTYLGVNRAVIALTKADLAQDEAARVAGLREKLQSSPFDDAPIVPTSVITGRGIDELKAALVEVLTVAPPPRDIGKPRLPVDRVFTLRGIGTVVTGTLTGGELRRGQSVVIQPAGKTTRIRSLQNHNRDVETNGPGTRTALNLPDVEGSGESPGVQRGDILTLSELGGASNAWDVALEKSARLADSKDAAARPLKEGTLVRIHFGSTNIPARVKLIDAGPLQAGERKLAQLRFESISFAFAGDRFIVRDWSEQTTLAGGVVLDADARRDGLRSDGRRQFLERRAHNPDDVVNFVTSEVERKHAVRRAGLLARSRFSSAEISNALASLVTGKLILEAGEWIADVAFWQQLTRSAVESIDAQHRLHPERPGLALSELRAQLEKQLPAAEVFDALTTGLLRNGFEQAGVVIRRSSHKLALPPQLQAAGAKVRAALTARPLDPPSRKELAPDAASQQALRFLVQTGEAVELGPEVVLPTESFSRATETVRQFLRQHGAATASELRQALGTSRRILIPLLERLDKDGVTRREGDKRVLRQG
jgi:selenocysteine-specific elongation factor